MSVKWVEVAVRSERNNLPLPLPSCDSWMVVKENSDRKKKNLFLTFLKRETQKCLCFAESFLFCSHLFCRKLLCNLVLVIIAFDSSVSKKGICLPRTCFLHSACLFKVAKLMSQNLWKPLSLLIKFSWDNLVIKLSLYASFEKWF